MAAVLALGATLAADLAVAGPEPRPAQRHELKARKSCALTCHGTIPVGARPSRWHSRQRFARDAAVDVRVLLNGRALKAEQLSPCSAIYYGRGAMAKVNTCRAKIRVKTASVRNRPGRLRIAYRRLP